MYRRKKLEEIVITERRREKIAKNIILFLPLVLSVGWAAQIKLSQSYQILGGEMLSPVDARPLLTSLMLFILGYVFFLFLMFSDDLKDFFARVKKH